MFHWFYGIVETAQSCWEYFKGVDKTKENVLRGNHIHIMLSQYYNYYIYIAVSSYKPRYTVRGCHGLPRAKGIAVTCFLKNQNSAKPMEKSITRQYPVLEIK